MSAQFTKRVLASALVFFLILNMLDWFLPATDRFPSVFSSVATALLIGSLLALEMAWPKVEKGRRRDLLVVVGMTVALWVAVGWIDLTGTKHSSDTFVSGVACCIGCFGPRAARTAWRARAARKARKQ